MKRGIKLLDKVVCRVPAFPLNRELEEVWDELKEMIAESSLTFYEEIKNLNFDDFGRLDEKARFTIFKYFNRAKNRATPFGRFASVTVVSAAKGQADHRLILGPQCSHSFPDWSRAKDLAEELERSRHKNRSFQANGTIYLSGTRIKYLFFNGSSFELSSIEYDESIFALLGHAHNTKSIGDLVDFLTYQHSLSSRAANKLVRNLEELQLLLPDTMPNIIGMDYFKRENYHNADPRPRYLITERKLLQGCFDKGMIRELPETFEWLHRALPVQENRDLDNFKTQFIQKFGQQEVRLTLALDPETGVGYGNLEAGSEETDIINDIKAPSGSGYSGKSIIWTDLNRFLVNSIVAGGTIQLESFVPAVESVMPLPNTFSAIVRIANGNVIVDRSGGCTANALLGRFSLGIPEIGEIGHEIAQIEAEANPDVLFFDIGYMAEGKIDNVNRRNLLYQAELAILSYSLADNRLQLDDIMIAVVAGEIVIRSQKLNRRLLPRVASAYNYVRSDLSVFRFLSDLQHQGIRSSLTFDFTQLVPDLLHYPRLQFRNVVVSLAKWQIPEEFTRKPKASITDRLAALKQWLDLNSIATFSWGTADQKLIINKDKDDELRAFLRFISGKRTGGYIEEYIKPSNNHVTDRSNNNFAAEFILTYFHENCLYRPVSKPSSPSFLQPGSYFLPGQNWLYFEIFCHHASADVVLSDYLRPFLLKNGQKLALWFFIRYKVPSAHIRFRLKLKQMPDGYILMGELSTCLEPLLLEGIISDIQVKTYWQETERYGADIMPLVEAFFWQDSQLALDVLHHQCTNDQRYLLSIFLMETVFEQLGYDYQQRLDFLERPANLFKIEFNISASAFRKVNEGFKRFSSLTDNPSFVTGVPKGDFRRLVNVMIRALKATNIDKQEKLIIDLFHMHVNRLFGTDQRIHEMVIYYYLIYRLKRKHFKHRRNQ